jgi:hypothetical protein
MQPLQSGIKVEYFFTLAGELAGYDGIRMKRRAPEWPGGETECPNYLP